MKKSISFILITLFCFSSLQTDAYITQNTQQHIIARHWYINRHTSYTSYFNKTMTMQKVDDIAQKTIHNGSVKKQFRHGRERLVYQHRFNKPVGWKVNGKRAYSVRVITEKNGKVITAFPV